MSLLLSVCFYFQLAMVQGLQQVSCAVTSGDNDSKQATSIELTDLAVGDEFQYAFTTYGQDGEEGYQNIGLILCMNKVDTYFDCADEDRYLYIRGSSFGTDHVEGHGVYAYVYPYGSSTTDVTNSAYGGTWDLSICPEFGISAPLTAPPTNQLKPNPISRRTPKRAPRTTPNCMTLTGESDILPASLHMRNLSDGAAFEYSFNTYNQDGEQAYQNVGLILCKVAFSTDCADEDRILYTRIKVNGTSLVEGDGLFMYVFSYGNSTLNSTESADGGTYEVSVCVEVIWTSRPTEAPTEAPTTTTADPTFQTTPNPKSKKDENFTRTHLILIIITVILVLLLSIGCCWYRLHKKYRKEGDTMATQGALQRQEVEVQPADDAGATVFPPGASQRKEDEGQPEE